jgi:hypothetical protein
MSLPDGFVFGMYFGVLATLCGVAGLVSLWLVRHDRKQPRARLGTLGEQLARTGALDTRGARRWQVTADDLRMAMRTGRSPECERDIAILLGRK